MLAFGSFKIFSFCSGSIYRSIVCYTGLCEVQVKKFTLSMADEVHAWLYSQQLLYQSGSQACRLLHSMSRQTHTEVWCMDVCDRSDAPCMWLRFLDGDASLDLKLFY